VGQHRVGLRTAAEQTGLDVGAASLLVADPLAGAHLAVPSQVRIREHRLEWQIESGWTAGVVADECLWRFLRLADRETPEDRFKEFAESYGVLGLGIDGKPGVADGTFPPHEETDGACWFGESLEDWRAYATNAKALLLLTLALRRGQPFNLRRVLGEVGIDLPTPVQDSSTSAPPMRRYLGPAFLLANLELSPEDPPVPRPIAEQRMWIGHYLSLVWLRHAGITPRVRWEEVEPRVTLGLSEWAYQREVSAWPVNSLFSVLAAQLASLICSSEYLGQCSGCGRLYQAERRPRRDQPHYCSEPCREDARRRAKRESAARRRANG
jgi:hypothetical protein